MSKRNHAMPAFPDQPATLAHLAALPDKASKKQEIEFLNAITDYIRSVDGRGTYLASLFSESLIEWASQMIHDDCPPNIWTVYQIKIAECQNAIGATALAREHLRDAQQGHEASRNKWAEDRNRMATHVNELLLRNRDLTDEFNRMQAELKDADGEAEGAHNMQAIAELEIIRLKARLYDLMQAGK